MPGIQGSPCSDDSNCVDDTKCEHTDDGGPACGGALRPDGGEAGACPEGSIRVQSNRCEPDIFVHTEHRCGGGEDCITGHCLVSGSCGCPGNGGGGGGNGPAPAPAGGENGPAPAPAGSENPSRISFANNGGKTNNLDPQESSEEDDEKDKDGKDGKRKDDKDDDAGCVDVAWLSARGYGARDMVHGGGVRRKVLCPGGGLPCGTEWHALEVSGNVVGYGEYCQGRGCGEQVMVVDTLWADYAEARRGVAVGAVKVFMHDVRYPYVAQWALHVAMRAVRMMAVGAVEKSAL